MDAFAYITVETDANAYIISSNVRKWVHYFENDDYLAKYAFGSPVMTVNYVVAMCNYAALAYKCQNAC